MYKSLYRANILLRLGTSRELLCKRLSKSREIPIYIKRYFDLDFDGLEKEISEFDKQMWHFHNYNF